MKHEQINYSIQQPDKKPGEISINKSNGVNYQTQSNLNEDNIVDMERGTVVGQEKAGLSSSSMCVQLTEQERRTRIAILQNRQAELETEIQLLKQSNEFDELIGDKEEDEVTSNIDACRIR